MVDRDAGRGRRLGWPDAREELSRRPARPVDETPWDGPGSGRGRALHPGCGLLDVETRPALPRPRPRLAQPTQRPSPHPTADRAARTPRPHGDHRPSRLSTDLARSVEPPTRRCRSMPGGRVFTGLCGTSDLEIG